jgi:hypothetical protein
LREYVQCIKSCWGQIFGTAIGTAAYTVPNGNALGLVISGRWQL